MKLGASGGLAADSTITAYDSLGDVTQETDPAGLWAAAHNAASRDTVFTDQKTERPA